MNIPQSGIYKITSPTGKIYIGQTRDLIRREKDYKAIYKKNKRKINYSIQKYGWENHKFEVIEECPIDQLNEREIFHKQQVLKELGWDKVLFHEVYDLGGGPKSEETRRKISEGNKGKKKPQSEEHKQKHKQTIKEKGVWWRYKLGGKGVPRTKLQKSTIQYSLNGEFIKRWSSASEAEIFYSKNKDKDNIAACCRGKQKTAYGFIWRFAN